MTSASNPAVPGSARIEALAERIAVDWGHHTHTVLTAMIADLYTDLVVIPPQLIPQRRTAVIGDAADTTASELITLLDDYLDRETDHPPVTEYGWTTHTDTRHHAVTAMLAALTADHLTWWLTERIHDLTDDGASDCTS